jgi:hypothetical protein
MGVFGKDSRERDFEKDMDMQEPYQESSDDSFGRDQAMNNQQIGGNFPSGGIPEGYYEYKRSVNLPEAQEEHLRKIDKDVVFGNFTGKKPSMEELSYLGGTIELFETEFVETIQIPRRDKNGNFILDKNGNMIIDTELRFDEAFRGSLQYLKFEYKFAIVGSRALGGTDRAAYLDISTNSRISKEFSKKKEQKNSLFGSGGVN